MGTAITAIQYSRICKNATGEKTKSSSPPAKTFVASSGFCEKLDLSELAVPLTVFPWSLQTVMECSPCGVGSGWTLTLSPLQDSVSVVAARRKVPTGLMDSGVSTTSSSTRRIGPSSSTHSDFRPPTVLSAHNRDIDAVKAWSEEWKAEHKLT